LMVDCHGNVGDGVGAGTHRTLDASVWSEGLLCVVGSGWRELWE